MNPGDYHRYRHKTLKERGTPRQLREKIKGLALPEAPKNIGLIGMVPGVRKIREGIRKVIKEGKAPLQSKSTRSRRRVGKGKGDKERLGLLKNKGRERYNNIYLNFRDNN